MSKINVRENKWTNQRQWQHWAHKTKTNTTQHRKLKRWATQTQQQTRREPRYSRSVGSSCLFLIRHLQCYSHTCSQDKLDTTLSNTNVITQYVVTIPILIFHHDELIIYYIKLHISHVIFYIFKF